MSQPEIKIEPVKARQGRWGGRVLMILVAALVLAMAAWWLAETYGESIDGTATQTSSLLIR